MNKEIDVVRRCKVLTVEKGKHMKSGETRQNPCNKCNWKYYFKNIHVCVTAGIVANICMCLCIHVFMWLYLVICITCI